MASPYREDLWAESLADRAFLNRGGVSIFSFGVLEGDRVKLAPLSLEHVRPLFDCSRDPAIWAAYPVRIERIEEIERFVRKALDGRERGEQYPYAVYDKALGAYVGSTRFLRIAEEHRNLNIGSTWYSTEVWRTRVNTETKFLLLRHAFESIRAVRVEIVTSTDNVRSQRAIERLGAIREGVLRKKYYGLDYVIYSIVGEEWPAVKSRLEGYLAT